MLRWQLVNPRDASHDQIMKNEEVNNLKRILGLQHSVNYKSAEQLRSHLLATVPPDV